MKECLLCRCRLTYLTCVLLVASNCCGYKIKFWRLLYSSLYSARSFTLQLASQNFRSFRRSVFSIMYACLYFDSDKSVSVLPKSKCKVRSDSTFEARNEVDVDWRDGRGKKERLIATILKVGDKGKHFVCISI